MKTLLLLSGLVSAVVCDLNCPWALRLDCTNYQASPDCGTDGITYANRCYFAQAYCKDASKSLHIYADTDCRSAGLTPPPTTSPTTATRPGITATTAGGTTASLRPTGPTTTRAPIFLGHNAVMDFFCRELSKKACPNDTEQICASDGVTYPNVCEFEKQRCTHRNLTVASYGSC